ncbi:MAG: FAD-dependent oxidoreductase [Thaumarchaeota archaeon]|nr:FAD-dependent oxidoreductase [Nitrososphaerota archaeon]
MSRARRITRSTEFDVVVVGSGASALAAALSASIQGASVVVLEKSAKYGGSSALSGGQLWIPNNEFEQEAGIKDSKSSTLLYLKRLTLGRVDTKLIESFVENAPRALDFLVEKTLLRPKLREDLPDYHPEWPGASKGGRTLDPGLFDGLLLGSEFKHLRQNPQYHTDGGIHTTSLEFEKIMRGEEVPELRRRKPTTLSFGEALIGSLRKALFDRRVPLLLEHRATRLLTDRRRVMGVVARARKTTRTIWAKLGVILAAGGFEWNLSMKKRYLQAPSENSAGCDTNTGDGIRMGTGVGATTALMDEAWWFTLLLRPNDKRGWLVTSERTLPGSIMVNRAGKRFANESMNYNDLTKVMLLVNPETYERDNIPSFLIFDSNHRRKYWFVNTPPGRPAPRWVASADSIRGLASKLRINIDNLETTVKRFNQFVADGFDPEFHRGRGLYDRHWGDPSARNPTLGKISEPPFYGIRLLAGDIGTKGGLLTDHKGQVLDSGNKPIPGLYAAGNNAASVMGPGYAASGATLGPCITFGYLAGIYVVQNG